MRKKIVLFVSVLVLLSLFTGCTEESYLLFFNDHIEGCKYEAIIYEPLIDEECVADCSEEWQLIQQGGCDAFCQAECNGCQECLEECSMLRELSSRYSFNGSPCEELCTEVSPKSISLGQSIPVTRCKSAGFAADILSNTLECVDLRGCQGGNCNPEITLGCTPPINYNCQIEYESYDLEVYYSGEGTIYVNGTPFEADVNESHIHIIFFSSQADSYPYPNTIIGIPSSITINAEGQFDSQGFGIILSRECCYECREKKLPATILYPKVDIEGFSITGGSTIIKDGKVISAFNVVPGTQKTTIQVENRGFFTQRNAMLQFVGLPTGVTVDISPNTQIIKAHNIGNYEATFTVGPNLSSGTYKVTMLALSPNGTFDTIQIDLVVP